jgi:transposase
LSNHNKGSEPKLNKRQADEVIKYLQDNTFMNVKPIIKHVKNKYGVKYTRSGITTWLKNCGFTYKKPHPVPAKFNQQKQEEFVKLLHKLKDEDNPLYFLDATHP